MVAPSDPRTRDRGLAEFAAGRFGVFSLEQAAAFGLAGPALRARLQSHRLYRVHHRVYSLVPTALLSAHGRWLAAVLACGPGAVASHQAAAALHGLIRSGGGRVDVTVPSRAGHRHRPGIRVHRSSTLRPQDVTTVAGIPCTTVARTALDLAETRPLRWIERLLDEAVVLNRFDLGALEEQVEHNRARSRAAQTLHRAMTEHRPGSTATDGEIGERMLAITRSVDLPDPEVQTWVDLEDGGPMIRPDFLWREQKVILETDGGVHRRGRRVAADARRDRRAARAGWQTLRVSWDEIVGEPVQIGETVLAVVTRRSLPEPGRSSASPTQRGGVGPR